MAWKILNIEPDNYSPAARQILNAFAEVDERPCTPEQLPDIIGDYDVLMVRLKHYIGPDILKQGNRLKAIVTATTGLDHLDQNTAQAQGIQIFSLRGEIDFLRSIPATAEHTWALLLALVRNLPAAVQDVKTGRWHRDDFRGHELAQKTIGIVGHGRIGEKVARYALAFGMRVLAYDPYQAELPPDVQRVDTLNALLAQSDIVSIHVPFNAETTNLIGSVELSHMRPDAVLINTARGAIVDEAALLSALQNQQIAGAALDVLAGESETPPSVSHPLVQYANAHRNLIITPHIGGATFESMANTEIFMAQKLARFYQEQVNKTATSV